MIVELDEVEVRVLGALVEKGITTPEYYPLSLNALKNACNQKSSRDPVVEYGETDVQKALERLREKHLVWFVSGQESRVTKYKHRLPEALDLSPEEVAALCVLILRGPQTAGEVKGRSERLHPFAGPAEVEAVLGGLATREEQPLTARLPRQPGQKEPRYAHLLSGSEGLPAEEPPAEGSVHPKHGRLEDRVAALEDEVRALKEAFDLFRRQFE
jgi:uncharacterized protein YceH (UPF0502 family)